AVRSAVAPGLPVKTCGPLRARISRTVAMTCSSPGPRGRRLPGGAPPADGTAQWNCIPIIAIPGAKATRLGETGWDRGGVHPSLVAARRLGLQGSEELVEALLGVAEQHHALGVI